MLLRVASGRRLRDWPEVQSHVARECVRHPAHYCSASRLSYHIDIDWLREGDQSLLRAHGPGKGPILGFADGGTHPSFGNGARGGAAAAAAKVAVLAGGNRLTASARHT